MKTVNFIEAVNSGKRFREIGETEWIYPFIGTGNNQTKLFTYNQINAQFELEEKQITITDSEFDDAWDKNA